MSKFACGEMRIPETISVARKIRKRFVMFACATLLSTRFCFAKSFLIMQRATFSVTFCGLCTVSESRASASPGPGQAARISPSLQLHVSVQNGIRQQTFVRETIARLRRSSISHLLLQAPRSLIYELQHLESSGRILLMFSSPFFSRIFFDARCVCSCVFASRGAESDERKR